MDEAAAIHDSIYHSAQRLKLPWIEGVEYLVWMVVYVFVGLIDLLIAHRPVVFLWGNFRQEALWVTAGGAIFAGGGIGIEIVTHYLYGIAIDTRF